MGLTTFFSHMRIKWINSNVYCYPRVLRNTDLRNSKVLMGLSKSKILSCVFLRNSKPNFKPLITLKQLYIAVGSLFQYLVIQESLRKDIVKYFLQIYSYRVVKWAKNYHYLMNLNSYSHISLRDISPPHRYSLVSVFIIIR